MPPETKTFVPKPLEIVDPELYEANREAIREAIWEGENSDGTGQYPGLRVMCEAVQERTGVDLKELVLSESGRPKRIKWPQFMEACRKLSRDVLHEAVSEPTLMQLVRAGVNLQSAAWYEFVPTDFERVFWVMPSKYAVELHAPMHLAGAPVRTMEQEPFRMTDLKALDLQLRNWKFMAGVPIARELFEDDQTGQVQQRIQGIATNQKLMQENWAFQRWIGSAANAQIGNDAIPASETKTNPYSTTLSAGVQGVVANRLTTFAAFSEINLQALDVLAMNMYDLNGNKLFVNPNTLLTGTALKFVAEILVSNTTAYYASTVPAQLINTGTKSAGPTNVGTTFAKNVMAGRYQVVTNRFLPPTSYGMIEAGKGFVVQLRVPMELTMEDPNAGESFRRDAYVWRSRSRFNADHIDERFSYMGNDGTV